MECAISKNQASQQETSKTPIQRQATSEMKLRISKESEISDWWKMFKDLVRFTRKYGHCHFPHRSSHPLSHWVVKQRKLFASDDRATVLSEIQIKALRSIGFVFSPSGGTWLSRFYELREFKRQFGHCNVKRNCSLGRWVAQQRADYVCMLAGGKSAMKMKHVKALESLSLEWCPFPTSPPPRASHPKVPLPPNNINNPVAAPQPPVQQNTDAQPIGEAAGSASTRSSNKVLKKLVRRQSNRQQRSEVAKKNSIQQQKRVRFADM